MDEPALDRIRVLIARFYEDRKMRGFAAGYNEQTAWCLRYFLDFLKMRDEADLTAVTADTMFAYQAHIFNRRGFRREKLCLVSQMHVLGRVRVFFQWLVRRGHILADPSAVIRLPKRKRPLPTGVMTKREVEKVLAQPDLDTPLGLRDRAILELLYSSGLRASELINLKLHDVNLADREIMIRKGKGGKDRVVPVGEVAAKYMEMYLEESREKLLRGKEDGKWLFIGRLKAKMERKSLNFAIVQRYCRRAGLKKHVTTHGFRHTCATHLLKGRADIRHIQELLGHESLESTRIYTRVEVGDLKRALKRCHPREQSR